MKQKLLFILATSALSLCAAVKPIGIDLLDYKINSDPKRGHTVHRALQPPQS